MRPLLDDAEKDNLAAGEALLGAGKARPEDRGDGIGCQHRGPRLAAVELEDKVLIAPDRNEQALRIGDAFDDPGGVAAAQAGAFEPGMGIEIGRSHWARVAYRPRPPQPASRFSERGETALQEAAFDAVGGQTKSPPIGLGGRRPRSEPAQHVGTRRMIEVIAVEGP